MQQALMIVAAVFLLSACKSTDKIAVDARLLEPSEQNVQAIQDAIAPFFNGSRIPLAYDVFTRSSELVIDQRRILDRAGNVINGKDITLPGDGNVSAQRFLLKISQTNDMNEGCFLVHEASGMTINLALLECVPAEERDI